MDYDVFKSINNFAAHHDGLADPLQAYVQASELIFALGLVVMFLLAPPALKRAAVAAVLSAGLGLLVAHFLAGAIGRTRPFVAHPATHLLIAHGRDPGFPSDHATGAFAIGFALVLRHRLAGVVALVLALVLAVGRVAVGVHYPADVLAGALLGFAAALTLWTPAIRERIDGFADVVAGLPILRSAVRGSYAPPRAAGS